MKALAGIGLMLAASVALAATPAATRAEVTQLMTAVEKSQCKFNRNGSWYDAKAAREHLEQKFAYLDKKDMLTSTESFIERGASASSMSGKAYQMQCGATTVTSAAWLAVELARIRKTK